MEATQEHFSTFMVNVGTTKMSVIAPFRMQSFELLNNFLLSLFLSLEATTSVFVISSISTILSFLLHSTFRERKNGKNWWRLPLLLCNVSDMSCFMWTCKHLHSYSWTANIVSSLVIRNSSAQNSCYRQHGETFGWQREHKKGNIRQTRVVAVQVTSTHDDDTIMAQKTSILSSVSQLDTLKKKSQRGKKDTENRSICLPSASK